MVYHSFGVVVLINLPGSSSSGTDSSAYSNSASIMISGIDLTKPHVKGEGGTFAAVRKLSIRPRPACGLSSYSQVQQPWQNLIQMTLKYLVNSRSNINSSGTLNLKLYDLRSS